MYLKLLRYAHPEVTHQLAHILLKILNLTIASVERLDNSSISCGNYRIFNIPIFTPIGTGAGIDKNGDMINVFLKYCGFHTVGSVLIHCRRGNPHPRLYRYVTKLSMINAMGLPSRGVKYVIRNVIKARYLNCRTLIVNIAGFSIQEFVFLSKVFSKIPIVGIIELNISCPQYKRQDLHDPGLLNVLLERVREVSSKPILVKVSSRIGLEKLKGIIKVCEAYRNVGLTIANSFPVVTNCMSSGVGGVSGLVIYRLVRKLIEAVRRWSDVEIVACGGIFSAKQVIELLRRFKVSAVQVVTAVAYEGPRVFRRLVRELELLESRE